MLDQLQPALDVLSHPGFQVGFITERAGAGLLFVPALVVAALWFAPQSSPRNQPGS